MSTFIAKHQVGKLQIPVFSLLFDKIGNQRVSVADAPSSLSMISWNKFLLFN